MSRASSFPQVDPHPHYHRKGAAFTLVEVLVSLAIFAMSAIVLGTAYVNVLVNYHAMQAWTADKDALALARATLLREPDRLAAERGGEMALPAGGSLRWATGIEETTRADLFRVDLDFEIRPDGPLPPRRVRESFLLLRPTWSAPDRREQLRTRAREQLAQRPF